MPKHARTSILVREAERIWNELFTTPVHLDSAISKAPFALKPELARILPLLLRQPRSLAAELGIRLEPSEPWTLGAPALARWSPIRKMIQTLEAMPDLDSIPGAKPQDYPFWMIQEWERDWGKAATVVLARDLALRPPLTLRVATGMDREEVLRRLRPSGTGMAGNLTESSPLGLRFSGYIPLREDEGRDRGEFEIQDEGSQVMALFALDPSRFAPLLSEVPGAPAKSAPKVPMPAIRPGSVIDACAGAGGKTLALADLLRGKGRVFSYDISARKLQALRRRASRAGLRNIQTHAVLEGAELEGLGKFLGSADVVLVDVPCSGWGVLKRNPDIKWRQSGEELSRLPELQLRLLETYSKLVKPGGRLVFGVCTMRAAESTRVVEAFGRRERDFRPVAGGFFGPSPRSDGFFMQAWERE